MISDTVNGQYKCLIEGHAVLGYALDPCLDYMTLQNATGRSSGIQTGADSICDRRIAEGWYRVVSPAGEDMPTSCVPIQRCGTIHTIWLNGRFEF